MTLFEKIAAGDIPSEKVYEDDLCFAIRDINPQAPNHLLIIPRKAIPRVMDAEETDQNLLGHLLLVSQKIADDLDVRSFEKGYKLIINNGKYAGEEVPHLHVHMLCS